MAYQATGSVRWRRYPEHIDLGLVCNALQDARKRGLTGGGAREGWVLSAAGLELAQALSETHYARPSRERILIDEQRWRTRERARLRADPVTARIARDGIDAVSRRELHGLFRLDDYIVGEQRAARIDRLARAFSHDPEPGEIVSAVGERIRDA